MTERYDNFSTSSLSPSAVGDVPYPYIWEHPVPWEQMEKYFQPALQEVTKKVFSLLMENAKSLEDYLSGAVVKINGGSIYGNLSVSGSISSGGDPLSPMPMGSVIQFAGSTAPTGWLFCDGTAYSQSSYSGLYGVIGSTYNTHCGQSAPSAGTFRVPNYKGRVLVALNSSDSDFDALTDYGGAKDVTLTSAQSGLPAHSHGVGVVGNFLGFPGGTDYVATDTANTPNATGTNTAQNASQAHTNLQPYAVVNYIIKY